MHGSGTSKLMLESDVLALQMSQGVHLITWYDFIVGI